MRGDPYWLKARFDGACARCGEPIKRGDSAFYYPQGRTILAKPCGHAEEAARDFAAHAADEANY